MFLNFVIFVVYCLKHSFCGDVIYHMNESEYQQMPPVFHLDPYEACLHGGAGPGVYCSVKFDLVTDEPSELYDKIKAYSAWTEAHFNHTQLQYGVCLTSKACNQFYKNNTSADLGVTLEACLNHTLWEQYKLKARITEKYSCHKHNEQITIDNFDIAVVSFLVVLLVLNLVGSLYDVFLAQEKESSSLLCFSVRRNYNKMVSPTGEGPDPRLERLKGSYGIKTINMAFVVATHAICPIMMNVENMQYVEERTTTWFAMVLENGALIIQTFFLISGLMLAYNLELITEKVKPSWNLVSMGMLQRWLRLTPPYAVMLAITASWMRHSGSGPLWQSIALSEIEACRRDWWANMLYVNNYIDYSDCMTQTWYLAADLQLTFIGLVFYVLTTGRNRKILLAIFFVVGMLIPVAHTYYQDLDGVMMITPETGRNAFITNRTFNHTYKRGHTNLASYALGFGLGLLIYQWQTHGHKLHTNKMLRFLFSVAGPMLVAVIVSNYIFYEEGPRVSIHIRALFAAIMKPVFGGVVGFIIVGMVFKLDDLNRNILEWPGWKWPSRVSYCAYIVHVVLIRYMTGIRTVTIHASYIHLAETIAAGVVMSFLAAIPFHLLVEAPIQQLIKNYIFGVTSRSDSNNQKTTQINGVDGNSLHVKEITSVEGNKADLLNKNVETNGEDVRRNRIRSKAD